MEESTMMKLIQGWAFAIFSAKLEVGDNVRLSARPADFDNTESQKSFP